MFKLSVQIPNAHDSDIRGLCQINGDSFASCSRDKQIHIWRLKGSTIEKDRVLLGHTGFVQCVASNGKVLISGGIDKSIIVWDLETFEPIKKITEHSESVSCLSFDTSPHGNRFVSGSWDKSAKVFDANTFTFLYSLAGHTQAVWSAIFVHKYIVTASADKSIKLWDNQICIQTINVHSDVVRGISYCDGFLYSCGNDAKICMLSFDPPKIDLLKEFYGHQSFIYAITSNASVVATSSEDKTVRLWKEGQCFQTIRIPNVISVWCCLLLKDGVRKGDLIVGGNNGVLQIFTVNESRYAEENTLKSYEEEVNASQINEQELGGAIDNSKLEGKEALLLSGTKDQQVKMIKTENGHVEAYQWQSSTNEWVKLGQVVHAVGKNNTQIYQGKEYDYVFDVDIQDGVPPLKLCFNKGQNPYAVAMEFIQQHQLPNSYLDQVANFITKNVEPEFISTNTSESFDPFTGGSRYVPGSTVIKDFKSTLFPADKNSYVFFKGINYNNVLSKLREFLTDETELYLKIEEKTKTFELGKLNLEELVDDITKVLTKLPEDKQFPCLDILRSALVYSVSAEERTISKIIDLVVDCCKTTNLANIMISLRILCNMFHLSDKYLVSKGGKVIEWLNSNVDFFSGKLVNNMVKQIQLAFSSLLMNYSICYCSENSGEEFGLNLFSLASLFANGEGNSNYDEEVIYRLLITFGCLLNSGSSQELRPIFKDYGKSLVERCTQMKVERLNTIAYDLKKASGLI